MITYNSLSFRGAKMIISAYEIIKLQYFNIKVRHLIIFTKLTKLIYIL